MVQVVQVSCVDVVKTVICAYKYMYSDQNRISPVQVKKAKLSPIL